MAVKMRSGELADYRLTVDLEPEHRYMGMEAPVYEYWKVCSAGMNMVAVKDVDPLAHIDQLR